MMKCKIHDTDKNLSADAVVVGNRVLVPMGKNSDAAPAHVDEAGQIYYTPFEAVSFISAHCPVPFSLVCEWEDFKDFFHSDPGCLVERTYNPWCSEYKSTNPPMPCWVMHQINLGLKLEDIFISDEKWGYCNSSTGQIIAAPQWEWCGGLDEYEYSVAKQNSKFVLLQEYENYESYSIHEDKILKTIETLIQAGSGIYLFYNGHKWGAIKPCDSSVHVPAEWDGIWWDGCGGYTVMTNRDNGGEMYGIVTITGAVVSDLTAMPIRRNAVFLAEETYDKLCIKFRIVERTGKYGLVKDWSDTIISELLLEPIHTWREVEEALIQACYDAEMRWYKYY